MHLGYSELLRIGIKTYRGLFKNTLGIKQPIVCGFKLTYRCNLKCKMCPFWKRKSKEMNTKRVKDALRRLNRIGISLIAFEGGEPLLRDDIGEILSFSRRLNLSTSIVTNGALLENKKDEIVPNLNGAIYVSIDGLERTHDKIRGVKGTFKKAMAGIVACQSSIPICMNTTITNDNLHEVEEVVKLAKTLGVNSSIELAVDYSEADFPKPKPSRLIEVIDNLIKMKKRGYPIVNSNSYLRVLKGEKEWRCRPWTVINVNPDGKVVIPCYAYKEYEGSTDVLDSTLVEKWKNFDWNQLKGCKKCNLHCYVEPSMILTNDLDSIINWSRIAIPI